MKDWGSDPGEKPDRWLSLEATVLGASVLVAYAMGLYVLLG